MFWSKVGSKMSIAIRSSTVFHVPCRNGACYYPHQPFSIKSRTGSKDSVKMSAGPGGGDGKNGSTEQGKPKQANRTSKTPKSTDPPANSTVQRRLLVKRNPSTPRPESLQQPSRLLRRKKPRRVSFEIKDQCGQPVLMLPNPRGNNSLDDEENSRSTTVPNLPVINASALLNSKSYCIHSATAASSNSGTEAAKRLLKGRQDFLQVLRHVVHRKSQYGRSDMFVLEGHGVPQQLLWDHVYLADDMLHQYNNAAACSFHHYRKKEDSTTIQWVRVRDLSGGSRAYPWPPAEERSSSSLYSWDESLQLYLIVMKRMTRLLGSVLLSDDDEKKQKGDETGSIHSTFEAPHHWNVEFQRGLSVAPEKLLAGRSNTNLRRSEAMLRPLVEWTPLEGASAPGHVRIRVQGSPTVSERAVPVTLSFHASFRYPES